MTDHKDDDLEPEYDFDFSKAQPNRFAARIAKQRREQAQREKPPKKPSPRSEPPK